MAWLTPWPAGTEQEIEVWPGVEGEHRTPPTCMRLYWERERDRQREIEIDRERERRGERGMRE